MDLLPVRPPETAPVVSSIYDDDSVPDPPARPWIPTPHQPHLSPDGLPAIPKAEPLPSLPPGVRSLYISVLRSNHIRVHHRLGVRGDMTDQEMFKLIRAEYNTHLLGFWRRWFTLKGLKSIQILKCVDNEQPTHVELDDSVLQEIMFAYSNPEKITSSTDWVIWAFKLKQEDKRFALDFVEGWQASRFIVLGLTPWTISFLMAIVWSARGGNLQTVFTVASFVLTAASSLLALLAIVSALES
ncbi:hypothetical protein GP486_004926 [Trichoglossum hirsutum]|uniref:Transmembrane protein n=1 Tax=Trichoglossum hirsutum TaxID=265104 RepID=A0A9P8LA29_9PEZI|nr:hypothetical protein GP486_004926 [Trichoglossum hirsutum]